MYKKEVLMYKNGHVEIKFLNGKFEINVIGYFEIEEKKYCITNTLLEYKDEIEDALKWLEELINALEPIKAIADAHLKITSGYCTEQKSAHFGGKNDTK